MAVLRLTQEGISTYNTGCQIHVLHTVAFLRITEYGSFTYDSGWQFRL